jgi:two-component system, OmpR family, alkaline phosphatase synthesis response regulator PhoP
MVKILIVDDVPFIRDIIGDSLEELVEKGAHLLFADNGRKALDLIAKERPDLVFLDVMMPEMNGFEVCTAVKSDFGLRGVRIVLVTANGQKHDIDQGYESGADRYVTKPFTPADIMKAAREMLNPDLLPTGLTSFQRA